MAFLGGSIAQRVGLQLLLEPHSSGLVFTGASVAAGAVYPAYATYKHLTQKRGPLPSSSRETEADRLLKYWTIAGSLYLGEKLLERLLSKVPYYPHAKFALVMWLLMDRGQAATKLFDQHLAPFLSRYEVKIDVCLSAGYQVMDMLYSMYRVPLQQAATIATVLAKQLVAFLQWFVTPENPSAEQLSADQRGQLSPRQNGQVLNPGKGPSTLSPRSRAP